MSDKQLVLETIQEMPETFTLQQISEEIAIMASLRQGRKDIDEGRFVTHDEMRNLVHQWTTK